MDQVFVVRQEGQDGSTLDSGVVFVRFDGDRCGGVSLRFPCGSPFLAKPDLEFFNDLVELNGIEPSAS